MEIDGPGRGHHVSDGGWDYIKLLGLPFKATEQDIVDFLSADSVDCSRVTLVKDRNGRASGRAFVNVSSSDMPIVLEKHKKYLDTRYVEVYKADESEVEGLINPGFEHNNNYQKRGGEIGYPNANFVVKLKGLPFRAGKREIRDFFTGINIEGIELIPSDRPDLLNNGTAYVALLTKGDMEDALKKTRNYISDRYVDVLPATSNDYLSAVHSSVPRKFSKNDDFNGYLAQQQMPPEKNFPPSTNLIEIYNIGPNTSQSAIFDFVAPSRVSNISLDLRRNFALVDFPTAREALDAFERCSSRTFLNNPVDLRLNIDSSCTTPPQMYPDSFASSHSYYPNSSQNMSNNRFASKNFHNRPAPHSASKSMNQHSTNSYDLYMDDEPDYVPNKSKYGNNQNKEDRNHEYHYKYQTNM